MGQHAPVVVRRIGAQPSMGLLLIRLDDIPESVEIAHAAAGLGRRLLIRRDPGATSPRPARTISR